jgi:uncharacterized protein (TIGR01777 family)
MNLLVSGAGGLVGTAVITELRRREHEVRALERGTMWDVASGRLTLGEFRPDAVIHLAGESIAEGRWTAEKKRRIRESRVEATERLAQSLAKLEPKLKVFISASAVGIYGDRGEEKLTEASGRGEGFLAEVCAGWETAAEPLRRAGVRVVNVRIGVVLNGKGGALAKMLPIFRLGLGGKLGSGTQWMSWIALDDLVRGILFLVENEKAAGAFNAVAPEPVRNHEFTKTLARVLRRPAIFKVPKIPLRMMLGEFADAALLVSQRVYPERLRELGFEFKYPKLESALRSML